MTTGEIIDTAARAYQRLGRSILGQVALPMVLCFAVLLFFFVFLGPAFFRTSDPGSIATQIGESIAVVAVGLVVALPLFLLGVSYAQGVVSRLVADFLLGNKPDAVAAAEAARRSLKTVVAAGARMFVAAFLVLLVAGGLLMASALVTDATSSANPLPALLSFFAILLCIASPIGPILVLFRYSLAPVVAVIEGASPKEALRRSRELSRSSPFQPGAGEALLGAIFLCSFLFAVMWGGTAMAFGLIGLGDLVVAQFGSRPLGMVLQTLVTLVPLYFALWVVAPLWMATCTIVYFDRRIRLEGFDIYVLEQDVRRASGKSRFQF
jgi:hypothetical protein